MDDNQHRLAERVKTLRERRAWSVAETARRSGLSSSMLWKVENRQTSLTYEKLVALAAGLEVEVAELFTTERERTRTGGRRAINHGIDAPMVNMNGNSHYFLAADIANKHLFPIVIEVRATDPVRHRAEGHAGEEFTYVLEGTIDFHCEGYAPTRLEAGDSVYFDACLRHSYICAEGEYARVICAYSSPQAIARAALVAGVPAQPAAMRALTATAAGRAGNVAAASVNK